VVPVDNDGNLIIEKQFRYPFGCVLTEIPAGKLDSKSEPHLEAAKRELKEETGYSAENMVYVLDMCGIYVSTGSACSANSTEISHVLEAIGLSKEDAMKTIRITLPDDITMEDIDRIICNITKQIVLLTTE
jgi:ADP-ribose pyrophosphatase